MSIQYRAAAALALSACLISLSGCMSGDRNPATSSADFGSFSVLESVSGPVGLDVSEGRILDAYLYPAPPEAQQTLIYPVEFIAVDIGGILPGARVELTAALPPGIEPDLYVDCSGGCQPFGPATIEGSTVVLTLVDGGAGDSDGVADGVIRSRGAPALLRAAEDTDGGDGVLNDVADVCPLAADQDQTDADADLLRDMCGPDGDNDGFPNALDAFPTDPGESEDSDGDGTGDHMDTDDDNDGVSDALDAFPTDPEESTDTDGDGLGDNADSDDDADGVADPRDNCPQQANADQYDADGDGLGDRCDLTPNPPDITGVVEELVRGQRVAVRIPRLPAP